jgi:endonuclease G
MTAKTKGSRSASGRRSKKNKGASVRIPVTTLLVLIAFALFAALKKNIPTVGPTGVENVASTELMSVEMPDSVASNQIDYLGYTVSFNPRLHIPNWVAWELTREETMGKTPRYDKFSSDANVAGCAETYDYLYSGYDRGHMAPAADMKWSKDAMMESFYLTNICPQARELNTGAWRTLEEKCRQWAKADSAIVIIAGPILDPAPREFIGDNRVAVPRSFFKVILAPYANPVRAIGFVMPNSKVKGGMQAAAVSVDKVEELTGYDFFAALPDSIENVVEADADFPLWSRIKP